MKDKKTFESKNEVDAPESRFQTDQNTDVVSKTNTTKVPATEFDIKPVEHSGSQLKQEVAAKIIGAKSGNASGGFGAAQVASATRAGLRDGSYSGDAGTILGSQANTPVMGKDTQGKDRVDKRISDANKDINYLASEQYATEFINIKPLAADQSTVGYNGNPMNVAARSQRSSGTVPAEILYDRSLDEIRQDKVLFVGGQKVVRDGSIETDYPTKTAVKDSSTGKYSMHSFTSGKEPVKGNFAPREITVTLKRDSAGHKFISGFEVVEDDLSVTGCDDEVVNAASVNGKIDQNQSELARQRIDSVAGSPTAEHYNPLGRSTSQPTQTVEYLRDMELSTGATMLSALRFALKSRAYYLSRTGKDGQDLTGPALDAMYGHLCNAKDIGALKGLINLSDDADITSTTGNRSGSSNILLYCFDSIRKYKTKADIVNQPRGLKLPLMTGLNNHTPFHYKPEFLKALNANDLFSTIDRGYDPGNTVYVTDGVRLVYPYSLRRALKYTRTNFNDDRAYDSELFAYMFQAGRGNQTYVIKVADPVLNGVAWFLEQHAAGLWDACGGGNSAGTVTLHIPTVHYGCHFGLWDLLLCASAPYIEYERTNSMKDILDFEMFHSYPFPELEAISDDAVRTPKNYGRISEYERLTVEQCKPEDAIRIVLPEAFLPIGSNDVLAPFYFNETGYDFKGSDHKLKFNGSSQFSTPVIRTGVRLAYLDDFFGMEPKDDLLAYDPMVALPGVRHVADEVVGAIYKYSTASDGLVLLINPSLKIADYLTTPRMLGWYMNAPAGFCRVIKVPDAGSPNINFGVVGATNISTASLRAYANSDVARQYRAKSTTPSGILQPADLTVERAQAFVQKWAEACANYTEGKSDAFDLIMSTAELFNTNGTLKSAVASFKPYADDENGTVYSSGSPLTSFMRSYWTRLQKLPVALNVFDGGAEYGHADPFDLAYAFGLAGFLAADYNEEKFNRINEYQAQMFGFVHDPYVLASPIFR